MDDEDEDAHRHHKNVKLLSAQGGTLQKRMHTRERLRYWYLVFTILLFPLVD